MDCGPKNGWFAANLWIFMAIKEWNYWLPWGVGCSAGHCQEAQRLVLPSRVSVRVRCVMLQATNKKKDPFLVLNQFRKPSASFGRQAEMRPAPKNFHSCDFRSSCTETLHRHVTDMCEKKANGPSSSPIGCDPVTGWPPFSDSGQRRERKTTSPHAWSLVVIRKPNYREKPPDCEDFCETTS